MKTSLIKILAFVFLTMPKVSQSQTDYAAKMPAIIPPSPEASSIFKFTETPVSMYNGLVNIRIPVYNIQAKGLEIPISLSYHSRGVKVEEIASRVGIGWSLMCGGSISRQVRDRADDWSSGYLREDFYDTFFKDEDTRSQIYNYDLNHGVDFDPDLFFFSFSQHSGKFIFDQHTKKVLIQDFQDIVIHPVFSDQIIEGFIATDDQGNKFYFGTDGESVSEVVDTERTESWKYSRQSAQLSADAGGHHTSWHLVKIETYYGEEITFEYEVEGGSYWRRSYDVVDPGSPTGVTSYFSKVKPDFQRQLTQINFPGGKVVFVPQSSEREDLNGSHALDRVEVYNYNGDLIKNIRFNYFYQDSPANGNELAHLISLDPKAKKRLFLESVQRINATDSIPPYRFEYSSIPLPNRFSNSQDVWGYYNGAGNGPYLTFFNYGVRSINRKVDTIKSEAGLLKKIYYPTGGSQEFIYEQNRGEISVDKYDVVFSEWEPTVIKSDGFFKNMDYWDGFEYSKEVSIGEGLTGSVRYSISFTQGICEDGECHYCEDGDYTPNCRYTVSIHGVDGSTDYGLNYGKDQLLVIPSGDYILRVSPNQPHDTADYEDTFVINLTWEEENVPPDYEGGKKVVYAGGKRIKRINYRTGSNIEKSTSYTYNTSAGASSGKVLGVPNFYSVEETTPSGLKILKPYGSRPGSPLTSVQGNEIGYSQVQEYMGGQNANQGMTEYEFTTYEDAGTYYRFPYHLPIDNEWLRGKPLITKYYDREGSTYTLVKKVENNYVYAGEDNTSDINLTNYFVSQNPLESNSGPSRRIDNTRYYIPLAVFTGLDLNDGLTYKVYYQTGGTSDLHSTVVTDYFEDEGEVHEIVHTTKYFYNYDNHYQLARTTQANSDNTIAVSEIYYPVDVISGESFGYDPFSSEEYAAIEQMKDTMDDASPGRNRFIPVQSVETTRNTAGETLSQSVNRTIFGQFEGLILPAHSETARLGNPLEKRVVFHRYDEAGNPLEISRADNIHVVYLWGYNKLYPVAEILNATYGEVKEIIGEDFDLDAGGLTISQKTALRTLQNAHVRFFEYKPGVGLIKSEDENELTTTYVYDSFNRLILVKDSENNILKQTEYYYQK